MIALVGKKLTLEGSTEELAAELAVIEKHVLNHMMVAKKAGGVETDGVPVEEFQLASLLGHIYFGANETDQQQDIVVEVAHMVHKTMTKIKDEGYAKP